MEVFHEDVRRIARKNDSYRKVLSTGHHAQVVVMSLLPGEDVGEEMHVSDELLLVVKGEGQVLIEGMSSDLGKGDLVHVPGGTRHDIVAAPDSDLKLLLVYSPPLHLSTTEHLTKAVAMVEAAKAASLEMVPTAV